MTKFAKKGHLVVDLGGKNPKMATVGSKPSKASEKKLLEKFDAPRPPKEKKEKAAKGEKKQKSERVSKLDDRKIKVINKKFESREGSKREAWIAALTTSKTIAEARGKVDGLDAGVVGFAVKSGIIELV